MSRPRLPCVTSVGAKFPGPGYRAPIPSPPPDMHPCHRFPQQVPTTVTTWSTFPGAAPCIPCMRSPSAGMTPVPPPPLPLPRAGASLPCAVPDHQKHFQKNGSGGTILITPWSVDTPRETVSVPVSVCYPVTSNGPFFPITTKLMQVDISHKPQCLEDSIGMYIDFLEKENAMKTQIDFSKPPLKQCGFDQETYFYEAIQDSDPFPSDKFRQWIKLHGMDIEIGESESQNSIHNDRAILHIDNENIGSSQEAGNTQCQTITSDNYMHIRTPLKEMPHAMSLSPSFRIPVLSPQYLKPLHTATFTPQQKSSDSKMFQSPGSNAGFCNLLDQILDARNATCNVSPKCDVGLNKQCGVVVATCSWDNADDDGDIGNEKQQQHQEQQQQQIPTSDPPATSTPASAHSLRKTFALVSSPVSADRTKPSLPAEVVESSGEKRLRCQEIDIEEDAEDPEKENKRIKA